MIENIDTSLIDWSRAQFALTAMYHWLFVPLTLGLGVIQAIMEKDRPLLDEIIRYHFRYRCRYGIDP